MGFGYEFLDLTPKEQATRWKINKCNYVKVKGFYIAKETTEEMKKQLIEWGKNICKAYT